MLNVAETQNVNNSYKKYVRNPIHQHSTVIDGYFYKENRAKNMAIKKVNKSLCGLLFFAVLTTFVSYYFVICNELTLNTLNRQIIALNDENAELQNNIDKLKSFNNVDTKIMKSHLLQKAGTVMEVPAVTVIDNVKLNRISSSPFKWAVGY